MAFIGKDYTYDHGDDGYKRIVETLGVPEPQATAAVNAKSTITLKESGGIYTLLVKSINTSETKFKLGEEVDETTIDGRKIKATFTLNGNVLTQTQKGDKAMTIVRDFGPSEMKQTITFGNITSNRVFKA